MTINLWERFAFYILKKEKGIKELNTPDINLMCLTKTCKGKLIAYKKSEVGTHFICLSCFIKWIKPLRGQLYRRKDIAGRLKRDCTY